MVEEEAFVPRAVLELELGDRSLRWKGDHPPTDPKKAYAVVRLHTVPIGMLDIDLAGGSGDEEAIFAEAESRLAPEIAAHLIDDKSLSSDTPNHLESGDLEPCVVQRSALLENAPRVSVVIATRDRPILLESSLESIRALEFPLYEVVIVDSSAGGETRNLILEKFPDFRYVRNEAGGLAVARNRGVKEARGEYLAFTDDDAEVDKYWVSELILALVNAPNAACATGLVLPLELETPAQVWFEESGAFVEGILPRRIDIEHRGRGSLLPYATGRIGAGVNMAWRREILVERGSFDPALEKCGAEDLAAYFDALCGGYEILYEPRAIVWHRHRRTRDELRLQTLWHATGLGAYLTRCLIKEPGRIWDLMMRIPGGLRYGFAANSQRNRKKSASFPPEISRQEWIGFIKGPAAYFKGSLKARQYEEPPIQ